jgi:hypothetical protein
MFAQIGIIRHLYPDISEEKYKSYLEAMIPHNYTQVAVFDEEECVGLSGLWYGIKLWCGKYLEIDNFIVHRTVASFKLNFTSSTTDDINVITYDVIGKQVKSLVVKYEDINSVEMGSDHNSGLYLVVLKQGNNSKALKVVKNGEASYFIE